MKDQTIKIINQEIKGCFDYFWYESNTDLLGYGLSKDSTLNNLSSIASVGFAFSAYVIGVERGFISKDEAKIRIEKTLDTLFKIKTHHGFFPHFIDPVTLQNHKSEYSTIDTTILLCGAIVAAEYFEGKIKQKVNELIERLDWSYFFQMKNGKLQINMAYSEYYWNDTLGFCPACWDQYAEQMMMYILAAGSDDITQDTALALFNGFERHKDRYAKYDVIHSFGNALFVHQFSHAFFPFQDYLDSNGFDWFQNSINATLANRLYCMRQKRFKTYNKNSWGLSAFLGEHGYRVFGAKPFGFPNIKYHLKIDGSVTPYAAMCSINFAPKIVEDAILYFATIPNLKQKYGFTDSYNLDTNFVSPHYLGIDKGPTIIMLDNYFNQTTWKYFTKSEIIIKAINKLKFQKKENEK